MLSRVLYKERFHSLGQEQDSSWLMQQQDTSEVFPSLHNHFFPRDSSLFVLNPLFPSLGFAHGKTLKAGAELLSRGESQNLKKPSLGSSCLHSSRFPTLCSAHSLQGFCFLVFKDFIHSEPPLKTFSFKHIDVTNPGVPSSFAYVQIQKSPGVKKH